MTNKNFLKWVVEAFIDQKGDKCEDGLKWANALF